MDKVLLGKTNNTNWKRYAKTSWAFELGLGKEEVLPK